MWGHRCGLSLRRYAPRRCGPPQRGRCPPEALRRGKESHGSCSASSAVGRFLRTFGNERAEVMPAPWRHTEEYEVLSARETVGQRGRFGGQRAGNERRNRGDVRGEHCSCESRPARAVGFSAAAASGSSSRPSATLSSANPSTSGSLGRFCSKSPGPGLAVNGSARSHVLCVETYERSPGVLSTAHLCFELRSCCNEACRRGRRGDRGARRKRA